MKKGKTIEMMPRIEAARLLVEMLSELKQEKGCWMNEDYYEAVSTACGYLLIDDVLPKAEEGE